jgi:hypothetical protein
MVGGSLRILRLLPPTKLVTMILLKVVLSTKKSIKNLFLTAELGDKLREYVAKTWPDGVVKIVRTKERSGLIRARLAGARAAKGDVIIFLDSHCEATEMWYAPYW